VEKAPEDIKALWPQAVQIIVCRTRHKAKHPKYKAPKEEIRYYLLTGPKNARALSAKHIARLVRGHWGIENRLHHVKDRTFREDDQKLRSCAVAVCWLRSIALTVLDQAEGRRRGKKRRYTPEQRSYFNAHPRKAIAELKRK
jgi:predicted transposase YbfD/YdcC